MAESPLAEPEAPPRSPVPSLLTALLTDHLDPGYAAAAAHRAQTGAPPPGRPRRGRAAALVAVALLLAGAVLGIAARSTEDNAPSAEKARSALQGDIAAAQDQQSRLSASAAALAAEVRATQSALGAQGPLATVQALELQSGLTAVTGPGLSLTIDGSATGSGAGVILDKDIQLLVNGLWSSGAEAIAIGGVRLQATSAIRQAGSAILVDNRPVFWPITIQAVGDKAALHVNLVGTLGFGRFSSFVSLYGIRFDLATETSMTLPAAGSVDLRYASVAASASGAASGTGAGPVPPTATSPGRNVPPGRASSIGPSTPPPGG